MHKLVQVFQRIIWKFISKYFNLFLIEDNSLSSINMFEKIMDVQKYLASHWQCCGQWEKN